MILKCMFLHVTCQSICNTGKSLTALANDLEGEKTVYFLLWEDMWVLQGELEIEMG